MNLRVLYIEDSEDDVALALRELKKGSYEVTFKRIETANQFHDALTNGNWDVILADYTVPGFGALPALEMLKQTGLEIPFIVVSGTIDEETAVSTLKAGASDYIMKDRMRRLIPAISNALSERKAIEGYHHIQAQLSTVIEMMPDIFFHKGHVWKV
jgi:DNA-binding NtrC family response regulator